MQTEVVKHALDLLVREPDIEGFFGALSKTMVVESESHTCAVWLIDEGVQQCELWMAYVKDRLFMPPKGGAVNEACKGAKATFPCQNMAKHLFEYAEGWTQTIEYKGRRPTPCRKRFESSAVKWNGTRLWPHRCDWATGIWAG